MSLAAGDRLGRYEILAPIGAGGMGEVYRAWSSEMERNVPISMLNGLARAASRNG
jgi:serine/threonine protein kinase